MTPTELFVVARRWLNDETAATYKWTSAELVDYYNVAMDEIATETDYFSDTYTPAVIHITLVAGTPDYALDSRVLQINSARIIGESVNLTKENVADLIDSTNTWRYINTVTGTDITFTDSTTDSLDSTTTDFTEAGFAADQFIEISGSTSNNKTIKAGTVTQYQIPLATGYTLTAEVSGDQVVLKSLNTGTPTKYCLDYRTGYITLSPCPDEAGVLFIEAIREPLTLLTVATIGTLTIEIDNRYHLGLVDGILGYAYLKSGPSTFNIDKSNIHMARFMNTKDRIKRDKIKLTAKKNPATPHSGAL